MDLTQEQLHALGIAASCLAGLGIGNAIRKRLKPSIRTPERRRKKALAEYEGLSIGGVQLGWPDSGIVISGSPGYGKTFLARNLLRQAIAQHLPIMIACPKPTDGQELEQLCREMGALDRFIRLGPGTPWRINLLKYLTEMPGGSAQVAGMFLSTLNDIATRSEGASQGEAYWMTMFETCQTSMIDLCLAAVGEADMELIKDAITDSPATPQEAIPQEYLKTDKHCARMIAKALARKTDRNKRSVDRAATFFMKEYSSIGPRARGAIMSMVNSILGRFLREPFYSSLCEETTLTPQMIEENRLIVALDYDLLTFETPGRMFQLAWIMLMQGYCLRRDPVGKPRTIIVRDEFAYFAHPGKDALVAAVSRSQKCLHIDLFQDFDLMKAIYGGGAKAESETMSGYSNHGVKAMFHQDNVMSAEHHSKLVGDKIEFLPGPGGKPDGNTLDGTIGVSPMGFHASYQPSLRKEYFATLPVGVCVLHANGKAQVVDLRE